jgi:hypothetical protein
LPEEAILHLLNLLLMVSTTRHFCRICQEGRDFCRRHPDHPRHFRLTLLTLGLWAPVWLALSIAARDRPWQCIRCRSVEFEEALDFGAEDYEAQNTEPLYLRHFGRMAR